MDTTDGRAEGFGPMPPIGTTNNLSAAEISAIMNHEKTSWGNNAKKVTPDEIQKLMDAVKSKRKIIIYNNNKFISNEKNIYY